MKRVAVASVVAAAVIYVWLWVRVITAGIEAFREYRDKPRRPKPPDPLPLDRRWVL